MSTGAAKAALGLLGLGPALHPDHNYARVQYHPRTGQWLVLINDAEGTLEIYARRAEALARARHLSQERNRR